MSKGNYSVGHFADYATRTVSIATFYTNPITEETVMDGDETRYTNESWWNMTEEEFNLEVEFVINSVMPKH